MSDIVTRLEECSTYALMDAARPVVRDAIDVINQLRAELAESKSAAAVLREELNRTGGATRGAFPGLGGVILSAMLSAEAEAEQFKSSGK